MGSASGGRTFVPHRFHLAGVAHHVLEQTREELADFVCCICVVLWRVDKRDGVIQALDLLARLDCLSLLFLHLRIVAAANLRDQVSQLAHVFLYYEFANEVVLIQLPLLGVKLHQHLEDGAPSIQEVHCRLSVDVSAENW